MPKFRIRLFIEYETEADSGGAAADTIREQLKKETIGIKTVRIDRISD